MKGSTLPLAFLLSNPCSSLYVTANTITFNDTPLRFSNRSSRPCKPSFLTIMSSSSQDPPLHTIPNSRQLQSWTRDNQTLTNEPIQTSISNLVQHLQASSRSQNQTNFSQTGAGCWQVVWAPHIARFLNTSGFVFGPIIYNYPGEDSPGSGRGHFESNVRYHLPRLSGVQNLSGWLSASGYLEDTPEIDGVTIQFKDFWVDVGVESPRKAPRKAQSLEGDDEKSVLTPKSWGIFDNILTTMARPFFFESLSKYPVLCYDPDIGFACFEFPPLKTKIAIVRMDTEK